MELEPYDHIVSIGDWCGPASNIRRRFGVERAMPFDWWVTPAEATIKLLDEKFANILRLENLEISPDGDTVLCKYYEMLHHHDFHRDGAHKIEDSLETQIANVKEKTLHLIGRFMHGLRGKRVLLLRNGLYPNIYQPGTPHIMPGRDMQIALATLIHSKARDCMGAARMDMLVLSNLEEGLTLNLPGGDVIFARLGEPLSDKPFKDENYDAVFDRFNIRLAE